MKTRKYMQVSKEVNRRFEKVEHGFLIAVRLTKDSLQMAKHDFPPDS